jgi:hypothetical protein
MPMNESSGIRRSNLTRQQRLEAEAALYGYPMNTTEEKPLTREDIEKMRRLVSDHDKSLGIQEWDLNKPASGVVDSQGHVQPYHYEAFPKLLYNHKDRTTKAAATQEEMDKLEKEGYKKEPFPPEVPQREYDMILGADNLPKDTKPPQEQKSESVLDRDRHADRPKGK